MSHPDEGVLQELLDGELAPADAAVIRAHLAGCASCAAALQELEAMQTQADAIVARLPLDPPLVQPVVRARTPRRVNLRMIALAASVVLVAGTSWMLLRSNEVAYLRGADDSAAGLALPMPSEERQEVPATTPATPPPPAARINAGADRRDKAKQAPRQAEKKETDAEGLRESESLPANAAPPVGAMAPPAASSLRVSALERTSGRATSVAGAEARLGTRLRTISGLTPVSVEVLPVAPDSLLTVRQQYVVGGVTVLLVQQALPAPRDEVTSKAREPVPYVDDARIQPGTRANGLGSVADSAGVQPAIRTWKAWGSLFQLRGALPADSIDALMKRVQ
jgi:anti-sigma factor RsiW